MKVSVPYGSTQLTVDVPENATILHSRHVPPLSDERAAFLASLRTPTGSAPLAQRVRARDRIAIVISDITRPTPNQRIVSWLLEELAFIPRSQFVILNGTGSHRANTRDELIQMLGAEIVESVEIVNHNAFDEESLRYLGQTPMGVPVWINRRYLEVDFRIVTGFIEPHFFAGFSGGPKMVAPGCAGLDTILSLHSARLIGDPNAIWGVTDGNPLWEKICQAARFVDVAFNINVTINKKHQVTNVFAGELWQSHRIGVEFARKTAMRGVSQAFDVVVTTNAGYPLDLNLYQTVKGMSAAAQIVRPGGAIVVASECSDGIPEHGNFKKLLKQASSPDALLAMLNQPGFAMQDQWEAQILALVLKKARVYLKAGYLSDQQIRDAMLTPISSVEGCVNELLEEMGPTATVGVLPQGPFTIPFVHVREPLAIA